MIELTTPSQLQEAYQWTNHNLPKSSILHLWFKTQLEHPAAAKFYCYADCWPSPNVLAGVTYAESYGLPNQPGICMFANLPLDRAETVENFLICLCEKQEISKYGGVQFHAINHEWQRVIHKVMVDHFKLDEFQGVWRTRMYYVKENDKEKLLEKTIQAPSGFEFDTLRLDEVDFVNQAWPHNFPGSEKIIEKRIRYFPNLCLREKGPNGKIACFEQTGELFAMITNLYTCPKFRRRGLAKIVEEKLAQKMAQMGYVVVKTVLYGNEAAEKLTEQCPWWTYVADVSWLAFTGRVGENSG